MEKVRETGVIGNCASTSSGGGASGSTTNAVFGVENESFGVRAGDVKGTGAVFTVTSFGCVTCVGATTFTVFGVDVYAVGVGAGGDGCASVAGTGVLCGTFCPIMCCICCVKIPLVSNFSIMTSLWMRIIDVRTYITHSRCGIGICVGLTFCCCCH